MTELTPCDQLQLLRNDLVAVRNRLSERYELLPLDDPRRSVARHLKAVISSAFLVALFVEEDLTRPEWWQTRVHPTPPDTSIRDDLDDMMSMLAFDTIVGSFSLFENGMRRILRSLDPAAASEATAESKAVLEALLARLRRAGDEYPEASEFLDLFRHMRNLVHNNGTFRPRGGTDVVVRWRGETYEFRAGECPDFQNWPFNCTLVRELATLTEWIVTRAAIADLGPIT